MKTHRLVLLITLALLCLSVSRKGALSRQLMDYLVIFGMLAASFIAIFLIPVLYYLVGKLTGEGKPAAEPQPPPAPIPTPAVVGVH
jgi:HAE1 family hydrophobic/amphiphilic exporter-1